MSLYYKCRESSNAETDSFVGVRFKDDLEICFPVGFNYSEDDTNIKKEVFLLLKTLSLSETSYRDPVNKGISPTDEKTIPINAFFWLVKDYLTRGLYRNKELISKQHSSGKIDWKKTIQRTNPVISKSGFVFIETYSKAPNNTDVLITEVQKYCLELANIYLGWLFGDLLVAKSLFGEKHIKQMIDIVRKEQTITFSDYKKELLSCLYSILVFSEEKTERSVLFSYGTENYQSIWEILIKEIFNNVSLKDYYPHSQWNLVRLQKTIENKPLRPDAIHFDSSNNSHFILDAKYYGAYRNPGFVGLPSTSDIEKQVTYGQELSQNNNIDSQKVYNALVLPYNKNDALMNSLGLHNDFEVIGYSKPSWVSGQYPFENIELIMADTKAVLSMWVNRSSEDVDFFLRLIEDNSCTNNHMSFINQ